MDLVEHRIDLTLGQVAVINNVLEQFGQGRKALLDLLVSTVVNAGDDLGQMVDDFLKCLRVLLFEDDASVATVDFAGAVNFVEVEAVGVGTVVAAEEVRAVLGCAEADFQGFVGQLIPV